LEGNKVQNRPDYLSEIEELVLLLEEYIYNKAYSKVRLDGDKVMSGKSQSKEPVDLFWIERKKEIESDIRTVIAKIRKWLNLNMY